jgi:hypothetical protein
MITTYKDLIRQLEPFKYQRIIADSRRFGLLSVHSVEKLELKNGKKLAIIIIQKPHLQRIRGIVKTTPILHRKASSASKH